MGNEQLTIDPFFGNRISMSQSMTRPVNGREFDSLSPNSNNQNRNQILSNNKNSKFCFNSVQKFNIWGANFSKLKKRLIYDESGYTSQSSIGDLIDGERNQNQHFQNSLEDEFEDFLNHQENEDKYKYLSNFRKFSRHNLNFITASWTTSSEVGSSENDFYKFDYVLNQFSVKNDLQVNN